MSLYTKTIKEGDILSRIDLTGKVYGRLTVLNEAEPRGNNRYWHCKCSCGNEKIIYMGSLRSGETKACGCLRGDAAKRKFKDLTGARFGKLTIIKRAPNRETTNHTYWECKCDCGNVTHVTANSLRRGTTTSCGCKQNRPRTIN